MRVDLPLVLLAFNGGLLLTLLLRPIWTRWLTPGSGLLLWALPLVCTLAVCLPAGSALAPLRVQALADTQAAVPALLQSPQLPALPWLPLVSMLGTVLLWIVFAVRYRRLRRRVERAPRVFDPRTPGLSIVRGEFGPALFGVWRAQLLLPEDFEARFTPAQQALALCHEYEHWRAGDLRVRALAWFAVSLQWWNPLLWWALPRLIEDQELACDARVLALHPEARNDYAAALVAGQEHAETDALLCSMHQTHPLLRRIAMLKQHAAHPLRQRLSWLGSGLCLILVSSLVWAARPAEADSAAQYRIEFALQIDEGESARFAIAGPEAEPMLARIDREGGSIEVEATISPGTVAEHVLIDMRLLRDGVEFAKPIVQVKLGGDARIEAGEHKDGRFRGVRMDATVTRFPAPTAADQVGAAQSIQDASPKAANSASVLKMNSRRDESAQWLHGVRWLDPAASRDDDC